MKKLIIDIIKDIFISILLVICLVIVLSLIFYDKIAVSRVIPETEEYFLTEEMQEEIEETNLKETEEIIINYYIDAADLKKYEKKNVYVKGKNHPFATTTEYTGSENQSSNSGTSDKGGFFEDDGTK